MSVAPSHRPSQLAVLRWAAYVLPALAVVAPRATAPVLAAAAAVSVGAFAYRNRRLPRAFSGTAFRRGPLGALTVFLAWTLVSIAWSLTPSHAIGVWGGLAAATAAELGLLGVVSEATEQDRSAVARALSVGYLAGLVFLLSERLDGVAVNYAIRDAIGRLPMGLNLMKPSAAIFAIFLWPAAAYLDDRFGRAFAWALAAVGTVVVISFGGATLAISAGAGLAAYIVSSLYRGGGRVIVALLLGVVLCAPLLARALPDPDALASRFPEIPYHSLSRLYIWKFAADSALEKPVHGWGLDSARALQQYKTDTGAFTPSRTYGDGASLAPGQSERDYWLGFYRDHPLPLHPHSGALQIWLELGLVGAVLATWFLWRALTPLRTSTPVPSPYSLATMASAASVGLVGFGVWQGWWLCAIWLAAVFAAAAPNRGRR